MYTSPSGPTNGSAPITALGPPVSELTATGLLKLLPPSVERENSSALFDADLPSLFEALSQATSTESRNGLAGLVSTAIIGLSLNFPLPLLKLKKVTWGHVAPPSVDFATAISLPWSEPNVRLKKATM